ncbi:MAG: hypothetical protein Q7J84_15095 [Sulfuricaulis sp.]|nr:hypothetical protein [Sulfuricaulis sp.]
MSRSSTLRSMARDVLALLADVERKDAALEDIRLLAHDAQGEWSSVSALYSPSGAQRLKQILEVARAALAPLPEVAP